MREFMLMYSEEQHVREIEERIAAEYGELFSDASEARVSLEKEEVDDKDFARQSEDSGKAWSGKAWTK